MRCSRYTKRSLSVAGRAEDYTYSTTSVRSLLENVYKGGIDDYYCSEDIIPAHAVHDATVLILSNGYCLHHVRQCLSDASIARKRVAWDTFFESMGFDCLVSRYDAVPEEDNISKGVDVENAECKLMNMPD